jgi:hypothetical protein
MAALSSGEPVRPKRRGGTYEREARSTWPPLLRTGRGKHMNSKPTTAKPIYGGLARRVSLTRVAGRKQELRNDDRTFRP